MPSKKPSVANACASSQDCARWHRAEIATDLAQLARALTLRQPGPYQVQAAVTALHARAPRAADADWPQIAALHGTMLRLTPTPVVELNTAVAHAMAFGLEHGLEWLARLETRVELSEYHLRPAAQAELLRRAGQRGEAASANNRALALAPHPVERACLERRRAEVSDER